MRAFSAFPVLVCLFAFSPVQSVSAATTGSLQNQTPGAPQEGSAPISVVPAQTLGDFLTTRTPIQSPHIPGFYSEVPPELDSAVRRLAEDNYSSAAAELQRHLEKAKDPRERARVLMWLGVTLGQQAIDYPSTGWTSGTSATLYLRQAIELDPEVFKAPDAARVLAEMIANGWSGEDPLQALTRYEMKAEQSRDPIDFYLAGMISRRLSAKAWSYSDTTEQDKRTLVNLAKSVARDPERYESWVYYLRALMPVGLHDLATSEAYKMYEHFKALRTPLLADQGPAMLLLTSASGRTMEQDQEFLDALEREYPDRPFPLFEKAMRAIETTASDALVLFPNLIHKIEDGTIKLTPREQGYYPSAYYKLAFLKQQFGDLRGSLQDYLKVRQISPAYADVNANLAVVKAQLADEETTGPKKARLLREAIEYAAIQEKHDFRGKSALRAQELRMKLKQLLRDVERDIAEGKTTPTMGTAASSKAPVTTASRTGELQQ